MDIPAIKVKYKFPLLGLDISAGVKFDGEEISLEIDLEQPQKKQLHNPVRAVSKKKGGSKWRK